VPSKEAITLVNDHAELARLEAFVDAFAGTSGLPEDERVRLLLILEELFTNVVEHGYPPGSASGRVSIALGLRDGRLIIEFVDDGRPFDPLTVAAPKLDLPGQDRPIGGLGVHIVRSLVDDASYRRAGRRNRLQLARRISPPAAGAPAG
jgi:serine/threonine-protein kinase RsbW